MRPKPCCPTASNCVRCIAGSPSLSFHELSVPSRLLGLVLPITGNRVASRVAISSLGFPTEKPLVAKEAQLRRLDADFIEQRLIDS
ncbi:hypothetical protein F442_04448 [Phytophthora nicotianae P10297]|uniref:Uncharacterized protein n=3 Tax=Phytophthora nicotianae TaxID=4792 RepID=W2QHK7_PHYN3|nr:hypothetical protein PPTG_22387 [Phytophthora nicotianae INRA-310]ETI52429.1 hypothetical protein F443_04421 [Phytophthora nicotianae P1569]ETN12668.1 hypothetical protein PPTG_22387 [Phytophthora nicotianae INRA-310]ETP50149.1 hypothetical protein F442_04448 [Phytophthora nicotianae P10297]